MSEKDVQEAVKEKYRPAAKQVTAGETACCGGAAKLCGCDPISRDLYDASEKGGLPAEAVAASLGCGNPTALAQLRPGEIVLDLGSGGGIDVLLSARPVGPTGKAYGLGMTEEMLALARKSEEGRRGKRGIPERNPREHTPAGEFCRRDHFELRDQSSRR